MKDTVFSSAILVGLLLVLALQFLSIGGKEQMSPFEAEQIRKFAATLESQELYRNAIQQYEKYLDAAASVPPEQKANLLYHIGTLYLDQLNDYENALATFLRLNQFYPQSPVARDAEKRMIACYEGLKRGYDAQKRLEKVTDLEPAEEPGTGPVVAQIGNRTITLDQLERKIAALPEYMRNQFTTPEKKLDFLRQTLFQDLLYDGAVRKELGKDPEVRRQLRAY